MVDGVDSVGKEDGVALQAGGAAQGRRQMGLAQADGAQEDDVGFLREEVQAEEVLHLEAIDFLGPVPLELFEGFDDRKAGGPDAQLHGVLEALLILAIDEPGEVFDVGPMLLGGLLGQLGTLGFEEGQFEIIQVLVQEGGLGMHGVEGLVS